MRHLGLEYRFQTKPRATAKWTRGLGNRNVEGKTFHLGFVGNRTQRTRFPLEGAFEVEKFRASWMCFVFVWACVCMNSAIKSREKQQKQAELRWSTNRRTVWEGTGCPGVRFAGRAVLDREEFCENI